MQVMKSVLPFVAALTLVSCQSGRGDRIQLQVSGDTTYTGIVESRDQPMEGFSAVSGRLDGVTGEFAIIQSAGRRALTIRLPETLIDVRYGPHGAPVVSRTPTTGNLECGTGRDQAALSAGVSTACADSVCADVKAAVDADPSVDPAACERDPHPSPRLITAAIAFTDQARLAVTEAEMLEVIAFAVDSTTRAFARSRIPLRFVVARDSQGRRCVRHVQYDETVDGDATMAKYLTQLLMPTHPKLGAVHSLRHECKADVGFLIVENFTDASGRACVMTRLSRRFEPYAMAVVGRSYMKTHHILTHELGHLMGAGHYNDYKCLEGLCSFSNAHAFAPGRETVMGDDTSRTAVLNFSDPEIRFGVTGPYTGIASTENARTLRITARTVSNFDY